MMQDSLVESDVRAAPSDSLFLRLVRVVGRTSGGQPLLDGIAADAVLALVPLPETEDDFTAVCRALPGGKGLAILGYATATDLIRATAAQVPEGDDLVLRAGRSELHLHADGRVRLRADDVRLESNGHFALVGAFIDLN
ncbi:MAG: hypothetical protein V3W41_00040 [Planctomycetota bacterium]